MMQIKKRKAGVGEPVKFMGCGICDNMSRSATVNFLLQVMICCYKTCLYLPCLDILVSMQVASATDDVDVLLRASQQLFASFKLGMFVCSHDMFL